MSRLLCTDLAIEARKCLGKVPEEIPGVAMEKDDFGEIRSHGYG